MRFLHTVGIQTTDLKALRFFPTWYLSNGWGPTTVEGLLRHAAVGPGIDFRVLRV